MLDRLPNGDHWRVLYMATVGVVSMTVTFKDVRSCGCCDLGFLAAVLVVWPLRVAFLPSLEAVFFVGRLSDRLLGCGFFVQNSLFCA